MSDLLNATLGVVGQVGESLDKVTGGRALRGALAGKPRELASVIPFSDNMGLTDAADKTTGRDLTNAYGLTDKDDTGWGASGKGFAVDMIASPLSFLGAGAAFKAAPTLAKGIAGGAKALTGLDAVESLGRGVGSLAKGAKGWASDGGDLLSAFAKRDAGSMPIGRDLPNPIDTGLRQLNMEGKNGSKAVRFSEDPARRQHYGADRSARFGARLAGNERPNYSKPIGDFLSDDAGTFRIPLRPASEGPALTDWTKGVQQDYLQALGDTSTPVGRLQSLSDSAGTKLYTGAGDAPEEFAKHFQRMPTALGFYDPSTRLVSPNVYSHPEKWFDRANMDRTMQNYGRSGELSTNAVDHPGIHEIGHALHQGDSSRGFFKMVDSGYPGFDPNLQKEIRAQLSKYGSKSPTEFVAEGFSRNAIKQGAGDFGKPQLSGDLADHYRNLGGPVANQGFIDKLKQFMNGDSGYLRHAIPGVDPDLANAMDGLGPMYPGGAAKMNSIADGAKGQDSIFSSHQFDSNGEQVFSPGNMAPDERIRALMADPSFADRLAGEIPEGSKYLGQGAEGVTFRTPDGTVIRVGDNDEWGQAPRPDLPEMLQAFRETQVGPYKVEHMPSVRPLDAGGYTKKILETRAGFPEGKAPAGYIDALGESYKHMDESEDLASHLRAGLNDRSDPWDATHFNTGITDEGKAIVFDGGAVNRLPEQDRFYNEPRGGLAHLFAPKPTFDAPQGDLLAQVMAAGGPEKVRESLRMGREAGTAGQGVDVPGLPEFLQRRGLMDEYLKGPSAPPAPEFTPSPGPYAQAAQPGAAPSLLQVLATLGITSVGAGAGAYAMSGQGQ